MGQGEATEIENSINPDTLVPDNDNEPAPPSKSMVVPAQPRSAEPHLKVLDDPSCFRHEIGNAVGIAIMSSGLIKREINAAITTDPFFVIRKAILEELLANLETSLDQAKDLCDRDRCERIAMSAKSGAESAESIESQLERLNISDILDAQVKLWRRVLRQDIDIKKDIEPGIFIMADRVTLTQIFSNVWLNAIQSMQEVSERKNVMDVRLSVRDGICLIAIQDNGAGIKKEHENMLFRPNFTTKKNGNGIGLPVCREKAAAMGGSFDLMNGSEIDEGEGAGATVIMKFPLFKDESERFRERQTVRQRQLSLNFETEDKSK